MEVGTRIGMQLLSVLLLLFVLAITPTLMGQVLPEAVEAGTDGAGIGADLTALLLVFISIAWGLLCLGTAFGQAIATYYSAGKSPFYVLVVLFIVVSLGVTLVGNVRDQAETAGASVGDCGSISGGSISVNQAGKCATKAAAAKPLFIGTTDINTGMNVAAGDVTAAQVSEATSINTQLSIARLLYEFVQIGYVVNLLLAVFVSVNAAAGGRIMPSMFKSGGGGGMDPRRSLA